MASGSSKREKIIRELVTTEETYVNSMTWLIENFQQPLLMGGIITPQQDDSIFLNAASILELHKPLLGKLKTILQLTGEKDMDQICIGHILHDLVPWLRMYTTYINGHQEGAEVIDHLVKNDDNFRYALNGCCAEGFTGILGISSLRLVPVQRVPRYVMLLKDLLQNTPDDHIDYGPLKAAFDAFQGIAEEINEKKREFENLAKLQKFDAEIKLNRGLLLTDSPYVVNHQWSKVRVTSAITCALPECKKVLVFGKKYLRCHVCNNTCHQICTQEMAPYCNQPVTLLKHDRFLIKDGGLKCVRVRMNSGKKTGDSAKPAQILLFTDMLTVLFPVDKTDYDLSAVIRWYSVTMNRKVFVQNSASDPLALVVTSPTDGDVHTFICDTTEDRDDWVAKIQHLAEDWFTAFSQLMKSESSPQEKYTRLFAVPQSVRAPGPKGKLFTSYVIQVNMQKIGSHYTILKQLGDLDKFHKQLKHTFPKAHIPNFPKRMEGESNDLTTAQSRCQRLELYFNELAQIPSFMENPFVKEFLQPDGTSSITLPTIAPPPVAAQPQEQPNNTAVEEAPASPSNLGRSADGWSPAVVKPSPGTHPKHLSLSEGRSRSRAMGVEARPEKGKFFRAIVIRDYAPAAENEIAVSEGNQVTILTTTSDGKYLVYFAGASGYVPKDIIELKSS